MEFLFILLDGKARIVGDLKNQIAQIRYSDIPAADKLRTLESILRAYRTLIDESIEEVIIGQRERRGDK